MSKIILFGHQFMTSLLCHVVIRKTWLAGNVTEHITLWTEDDDE